MLEVFHLHPKFPCASRPMQKAGKHSSTRSVQSHTEVAGVVTEPQVRASLAERKYDFKPESVGILSGKARSESVSFCSDLTSASPFEADGIAKESKGGIYADPRLCLMFNCLQESLKLPGVVVYGRRRKLLVSFGPTWFPLFGQEEAGYAWVSANYLAGGCVWGLPPNIPTGFIAGNEPVAEGKLGLKTSDSGANKLRRRPVIRGFWTPPGLLQQARCSLRRLLKAVEGGS